MVSKVAIHTNGPRSKKYIIKYLCVNTKVVTKEFLKSRNVSDILSIPIFSEYYINESNNVVQE